MMKTSIKLLIVLSLVCLASSAISAQSKTRKKRSASSAICGVASVPKGMVIVGYKPNPSCGQGMEMVVKRPAVSEIVCADSPVPEGYSVEGMQGSPECGAANPLANAMSITRAAIVYGVRVGMTQQQVVSVLGPPVTVFSGTKAYPGKGTTSTYLAAYKTILIYFNENAIVVGIEQIDR